MDMEKLLKILGMTGSSHDGEALVALRMAQRLMAAEGKTWKDLIGAPAAQPKQQRQRQWWEDPAQQQQQQWNGGWNGTNKQHQDEIRRAAEEFERRKRKREEEERARQRAEEARQKAAQQRSDPTNDDIACKHECLRMLTECPEILTDWEMDFLVSFEDRPDHYSISDKQRAVFQKLRARFREHRK